MTTTVKRFGLAIGLALVALGLTAGVYAATQNTAQGQGAFMARRHGMAGLGMPFGPLRMMAARLGLSDDQKAQIKAIAQSHRDEWKALADRAVTSRKALNDAVTADTIDETAIRQHASELAAVQGDIAVARAHARAEIFQVLTPEQRDKAKTMRANMEERFGQFRERLKERLGR